VHRSIALIIIHSIPKSSPCGHSLCHSSADVLLWSVSPGSRLRAHLVLSVLSSSKLCTLMMRSIEAKSY
jgi:hypothetical protein